MALAACEKICSKLSPLLPLSKFRARGTVLPMHPKWPHSTDNDSVIKEVNFKILFKANVNSDPRIAESLRVYQDTPKPNSNEYSMKLCLESISLFGGCLLSFYVSLLLVIRYLCFVSVNLCISILFVVGL